MEEIFVFTGDCIADLYGYTQVRDGSNLPQQINAQKPVGLLKKLLMLIEMKLFLV